MVINILNTVVTIWLFDLLHIVMVFSLGIGWILTCNVAFFAWPTLVDWEHVLWLHTNVSSDL